jgi:broad specificity polyphosphatase/5'/3'-nucleotidase SurE
VAAAGACTAYVKSIKSIACSQINLSTTKQQCQLPLVSYQWEHDAGALLLFQLLLLLLLLLP